MRTASGPKTINISLRGEFDFLEKERLSESLEPLQFADIAVLDFAGVRYIDATGIGCLIALKKKMVLNGRMGVIRIVNATAGVLRTLRVCGLGQVFDLGAAAV